MMNVCSIVPTEITFSEAQIVNCIKQIGFANTIAAANANNSFRKSELLAKVVFELKK